MFAALNPVGTLSFFEGDAPAEAIAVPEELAALAKSEPGRLVWQGSRIEDAASIRTWYVGPDGTRRAFKMGEGWKRLTCGFDDLIERDGESWRVVDQLARLKERLKAAIDAEAERQRQRWITPGAGQAMTYQAKVDEARALTVDPEDPDPQNYPLLAAEVGITAPSLAEVGTVVLQAYQQWLQIGGAIERVRLAGKQAVDLAGTVAEAEAVIVNWPA